MVCMNFGNDFIDFVTNLLQRKQTFEADHFEGLLAFPPLMRKQSNWS